MALVRYRQRSLLMAANLVWGGVAVAADALQASYGCLYAFTVGPEATPVGYCADADPLDLANNPIVNNVMRALGIESNKVRFKGCSGLRFSAAPDAMAKGAERRYLVTYPIESAGSYIAPITHELAHVLQMEVSGGVEPLREQLTSKRVELGADYLTGVIFSYSIQNIDLNQFQHNLSLTGAYVEHDSDAHGTPAQRAAAFRSGVYLNFDILNRDIRKANDYFQADMYGRLVHY